MSKLLIKNASIIATMDDDRNELINKSIYCEGGEIIDIGDLKTLNYNPEIEDGTFWMDFDPKFERFGIES